MATSAAVDDPSNCVDVDELIQAKASTVDKQQQQLEEEGNSLISGTASNFEDEDVENSPQKKEAAPPLEEAAATPTAEEEEEELDVPPAATAAAAVAAVPDAFQPVNGPGHVDAKKEVEEEVIVAGVDNVDYAMLLGGRRPPQPTKHTNSTMTAEEEAESHERRILLPDSAELGYGRDDDNIEEDYGEMDESHLRLKKRLSLMERMQSKFLAPPDETKERLLPQDTFSIMIIAETGSIPSIASVCIFTIQVAVFILVLLDLADAGERGNAFDVPANVPAPLRATQFIAILVAVLTQGDLRTASILGRDGFTKDFDTAFMDTAPWKYWLSIALRSVSGSVGLVVSFVLIITAPTVVDLLLNFTAIEFVSSIDELCFYLSRQGFLGSHCKTYATTVANTSYRVAPESRMGLIRRSWKTLSLIIILVAFLSGWSVIVSYQINGRYLCDTIMLQMGDDFVAALGSFNGLYDQSSFPGNSRVVYVERRSKEINPLGRGVVEYCESFGAWTFRFEETDSPSERKSSTDPCEVWVAKSASTKTYDVTDTTESPWFVRDNATNREVVLEPFRLACFDCDSVEDDEDFCGGKGICSNAKCECEDGWYGLQCEFPTPCTELAIDARTEPFASTRDWASDYSTITLEDGSLVEAYYRPVYVNKSADSDAYDVVMFTGRRWALTSSEFLPRGGKISDGDLLGINEEFEGTGDEIGNFFRYIYHGYRGYFKHYSVAFLSDFMDAKTDRDANSPVGFQWFRAMAELRTAANENQKPSQEVDALFLCRVCNDEGSNPCLYDGECVDGACQCSLDSFGSLCEVPPVQNGHCDPFFNTPEFKMDGGDCCESTCISTEQYVCGAEDQGYVNTGYYSCRQPREEWQDYRLSGEAGSYAGFSLGLSLRSVAVGELLQDRVRIFDKVGSSWELRDTIISTIPNTRFGSRVAISAGPYNVVSNPSFLAPLTVAVLDGLRVLRIYRCNLEGCSISQEIPAVYSFDLSDDGTVLSTTVLDPNLWPPPLIRIYEMVGDLFLGGTFQRRADVNVASTGATYTVSSQALSGDGTTMVLQKQRLEIEPQLGGYISRGETFEIYAWNGTFYNLEYQLPYQALFNAYAFEFSLAISQDASVIAYGVQLCRDEDRDLQVFDRTENNTWVARAPPPINETECIDTQRPARNNNLALSKDGSMVAFRLGTDVTVFKWESNEWKTAGEDFPTTPHYPVALSSDGRELAIGSPEQGIGGITEVYSLPGTKECPTGTNPLRISLTLDRLPVDLEWRLLNNHTGEVLFEQGHYPMRFAFGTIVEETCVDVDSHCFEFSIYNRKNRGLQAPGKYALFLDGKDIGRGTFSGLFESISFGNCLSCPEGMEPLKMIMLSCAPLKWEIFEFINNNTGQSDLQVGNLPGTDPHSYESCGAQNGRICENPAVQGALYEAAEVEYSICVDPKQCYGVRLTSPNRQVSFVELELGGYKNATDGTEMCAGYVAAIGNPDKCPSIDEDIEEP